MDSGSRIFTSYRGLGLVSNEIPFVLAFAKNKNVSLISTVIGNAFHTYEVDKLKLIDVGSSHPHPIKYMAGNDKIMYTACEKTIYLWRKSTNLISKFAEHADDVYLIYIFGPHIISVDQQNILYIWTKKTSELYLEMEFPTNKFQITTLLHPLAYLNKLLIGSKQGALQLWNIHSSKLIYTFKGWDSEVTSLEQAPALDVVAIGLHSGDIYVHNLKFDETVMKFKQSWGPVTALSFRSDGPPIMVSGSTLGHIAIWDLEEKRILSHVMNAHKKAVSGLKCLLNEPKLVTSSADNSLVVWMFDLPDGGVRKYAVREGHSAPPLMARFLGVLGNEILTCGEDSSLRRFSTVLDILNRSLGVAKEKQKKSEGGKVKMPPIVSFTCETSQENPWDNVACIHRNRSQVTTWSTQRSTRGDHLLEHPRFKVKYQNATASCLEISVCGNFVVIGYTSGHLDKYNIQSGLYRGSFDEIAHYDIVSGLAIDGSNQVLVSGDHKGILKWWKFKVMTHICQLDLEVGISVLHCNRDSGLLAIALEDWQIKVVDIDTRTIVRSLVGHSSEVNDLSFSPDSKWLVSASMDRTIRIWDLPTSTCIDMFCVPVAAISLSMSPTGEFLATVHAGHLGVYLWANKMCLKLISLHPLPENFSPPLLVLPSVGLDESEFVIVNTYKREDASKETEEDMEVEEYHSPEQLSDQLVTMSSLPTSRWLNLLQISAIKRRNAPVEPPRVPKSAPFFIPTVPGLDFKFAESSQDDPSNLNGNKKTQLKSVSIFESITVFGEVLKSRNYQRAMDLLKAMGPAAVDTEIRNLDPETGGSEELILNFLRMLKHFVRSKTNFEVTQAYLGLFLKIHSDFIVTNEEAQELCAKLLLSTKASWHSLQNSLNQSLSILSYLKNAAILNY